MSGRRPAALDSSLLARKGAATPAVPDDSPLVLQLDERRPEPATPAASPDDPVHLLTEEVPPPMAKDAPAERNPLARRAARRWWALGGAGVAAVAVVAIVWLAVQAPVPSPPQANRPAGTMIEPSAGVVGESVGLRATSPAPAAAPRQSEAAAPGGGAATLPTIAAQVAVEPASGAKLAPVPGDEGPSQSPLSPPAREPILPVNAPAQENAPADREADSAPTISTTVPKSVSPVPLPKAKPAVAQAPARVYAVQLASIAVEEKAREEAFRLQKKLDDVLGGREIKIEKATVAKGTTYRLRVGGFASLAEARATCSRVSRLKVDCLALRR